MSKKYKIGYASGAFDLLHVGHINLLKRAKELCDYLVAGVYSDDCIMQYKGKKTFFDTDMRKEIIKSIKYVDEVSVRENRDKLEAWNDFKFDVLIIGDDWKGSEEWNRHEEEMKGVGADIVYLPYTKGISASIIKERIKNMDK
jgi:glycerol-3-phosphate cytidylyltransferase